MTSILDGVVIGGAGGAIAGLTVSLANLIGRECLKCSHKRRVYAWLQKNTSNEDGKRYRTTRTIASWTNLTEERVRYICSHHNKIYMSTGNKEDLWGIYDHGDRVT